jgi:hypothetical protein
MEDFKGISPHRPLSEDGKQIRIIKLLPNTFSAPVECELEHIILEPEADYEAVSYCWGKSTITQPILLDGKPYPITLNLLCGLRYFRRTDSPRRLWVDSLCINQKDRDERSREILKMRDIYKLASGVLVWLGDYDPYTRAHVKGLFDFVKKLADYITEEDEEALIRAVGFDRLWQLQSQLREFIQTREWFQRMWVLQEVAVRPKPYVSNMDKTPNLICGDLSLPFPHLRNIEDFWVSGTSQKRIALPSICSGLDRLGVIWDGHQDILEGQDSPLAQRCAWILAQVAARFQSTDQRDVVYATLGLLNAESLPAELIPDYKKEPNEVFIDCAAFIVAQSRSLVILQFNSMKTPGLPSWVPDWRHGNWFQESFKPRPHPRTHVRVLREIEALEVNIIALTEVTRNGPQLDHHEGCADRLVSSWSDFFLDAEEYLNSKELPLRGYSTFGKAVWQLLLAFDANRHEANELGYQLGASENVPPFFFREKSCEKGSESAYGLHTAFRDSVLMSVGESISRRYLFRGMDGSIGIVSQPDIQPQPGDLICTVVGAYSDFILRRYSDGFRIIGLCERTIRGFDLTVGEFGFDAWISERRFGEFFTKFWDEYEAQRVLLY